MAGHHTPSLPTLNNQSNTTATTSHQQQAPHLCRPPTSSTHVQHLYLQTPHPAILSISPVSPVSPCSHPPPRFPAHCPLPCMLITSLQPPSIHMMDPHTHDVYTLTTSPLVCRPHPTWKKNGTASPVPLPLVHSLPGSHSPPHVCTALHWCYPFAPSPTPSWWHPMAGCRGDASLKPTPALPAQTLPMYPSNFHTLFFRTVPLSRLVD